MTDVFAIVASIYLHRRWYGEAPPACESATEPVWPCLLRLATGLGLFALVLFLLSLAGHSR